MTNSIFEGFAQRQYEEGMRLSQESDLLDLLPYSDRVRRRFIARFSCFGLVQMPDGEVCESNDFAVGIWFPDDYMRRAEPFEVLTWLHPREIFHPNISDKAPFICIGRLAPGTELVDLLYQIHEVITWQKVTMREDDALNLTACAWARRNQDRFPIDERPLKRGSREFTVNAEETTEASSAGGVA